MSCLFSCQWMFVTLLDIVWLWNLDDYPTILDADDDDDNNIVNNVVYCVHTRLLHVKYIKRIMMCTWNISNCRFKNAQDAIMLVWIV